jgi:metal-responsive CopG/Arc/MetJ family transcriptional regulator
VKTAISVPDAEFERFERVAARHGMNRSEFYQQAGRRLADELEGVSELTALANAAIARAGQPAGDGLLVSAAQESMRSETSW